MKAHSITLSAAAVIGAFALFATPAEAGGRKHHRHQDDDCYRGRNEFGYYERARFDRPRYYYEPVRYLPAPAFQIGFVVGGGGGYRHCR
jgi:hypothetical protein